MKPGGAIAHELDTNQSSRRLPSLCPSLSRRLDRRAGNQFLPPTTSLAEHMDSVNWNCTIAHWNLVVSVGEDCVQVSQDTHESYDAECRIGSRWPVQVHEEPAILGLRSDLPERGSTSQFGLRIDSVTTNPGSL